MAWFVEKVLPGVITGLPYMIIGGVGLWWNLRRGQQHVEQITAAQTQKVKDITAAQTQQLLEGDHSGRPE